MERIEEALIALKQGYLFYRDERLIVLEMFYNYEREGYFLDCMGDNGNCEVEVDNKDWSVKYPDKIKILAGTSDYYLLKGLYAAGYRDFYVYKDRPILFTNLNGKYRMTVEHLQIEDYLEEGSYKIKYVSSELFCKKEPPKA